jgi:hypothetical protein
MSLSEELLDLARTDLDPTIATAIRMAAERISELTQESSKLRARVQIRDAELGRVTKTFNWQRDEVMDLALELAHKDSDRDAIAEKLRQTMRGT